MQVLAHSSSMRTEWVILDGGSVFCSGVTSGINPYFMQRREISHLIRLELPEEFFRHRYESVTFYGAGCANPSKNKIVELSLVAQFKSPATVMSDLLGAARGLLGHSQGLVAILADGTNSCFYDGEKVTKNVTSGGYLLGDEGSSCYLAKNLLSDIIKGIAPEGIINEFFDAYDTNTQQILDSVYTNPQVRKTLVEYSRFLETHLDDDYCQKLVYSGFIDFFDRNIKFYQYQEHPIAVVGNTAATYRDILISAAHDYGINISRIEPSALPGLIKYHQGT